LRRSGLALRRGREPASTPYVFSIGEKHMLESVWAMSPPTTMGTSLTTG
jgi:hypothetical protein